MNKSICDDYPLLSKINSPKDLNNITDLKALCHEIRQKLIHVVSKNGGHLASNLGVVELTVALHSIFNDPSDKIIWDVGHQSYVHKMLTGRFEKIDTIRMENGISGFTNRKESIYDCFTTGHSSTSISSALGIASANKMLGNSGRVVAVIGDGSLTGGLAYEGLNNAGRFKRNFTIVLNDNKMSISKNVGAVARYLSAARIRPFYVNTKNFVEKMLDKTTPGSKFKSIMKRCKSALKRVIYKNNIFEDMGFEYYGPVDGHNLTELQKALKIAYNRNKPTVVHVITEKGKGYKFAEKDPKVYHGVSSFNIENGVGNNDSSKTFSSEFSRCICGLAEIEPRVCAITAAMTSGTGLSDFKKRFKNRFFDVGIAEGHAVTFASGLAAGGALPVFAVYSSFLQRSYDQIIHDASLQGLKIVLAVDRAGFVGEDGETHHGIFDIPFLNTIPNIKIYAPSFLEEMEPMLSNIILKDKNLVAIRYPRGGEFNKPEEFKVTGNNYDFYGPLDVDTLVVTYGRIFSNAYFASKMCGSVCVLKLNVVKPIDISAINKCLRFKNIVFFEESIKSGGVAEKFGSKLLEHDYHGNYKIVAVNNEFVPHGFVQSQLAKCNLDTKCMVNLVKEFNN